MNLTEKSNNPVYAVDCFLQGLKLLGRTELRKYLLIPIAINLVLYSVVFALGYYYISDLIAHFIPSWLSWLEWLIWPLFFMSFSIVGFFSFTILANLIASHFG
jgi:CysZ protein